MKRLGSIGVLLAVAAAIASTPSCGSRSLVLIDVEASKAFDAEPIHLQDVRLTITANRDVTTRFPLVRLSTTRPYQIGVYLPAEMSGRVTFDATIDDGSCVWGMGSADAPNVQSGETTALVKIVLEPTGSCVPIGGTGTAGTGGMTGAAGAGGMTGAAGTTGAAGAAGSSGAGGGIAGASGRGGVTGTAGIGGGAGAGPGIAGRGGATGTAGMGPGTGGSGPAGTTGTAGIGGMTGVAGRGGSVGTAGVGGMITGTAGIGGMTGIAGRGGTTGIAGSGPAGTMGTAGSGPGGRGGTMGVAGNLGTGGTTVCICADPKRVCDLSSGACICAQSPLQACLAAGIPCGYTTNNCGEQVFCDCLIAGSVCDIQQQRCFTTCPTGTGGPITTEQAEIICPDTPTASP